MYFFLKLFIPFYYILTTHRVTGISISMLSDELEYRIESEVFKYVCNQIGKCSNMSAITRVYVKPLSTHLSAISIR